MFQKLVRRFSPDTKLSPLEEHAHLWCKQIGSHAARISATGSGGLVTGFDPELGLSHGWLAKAEIRPRLAIHFEPNHATQRGHVAVKVRTRDVILSVAALADCSQTSSPTSMTSRCLSFFDGAVLGSAQFFGIKPVASGASCLSFSSPGSSAVSAKDLMQALEALQKDTTQIPRTREGSGVGKILPDLHLELCTASARRIVWKSNLPSTVPRNQPTSSAFHISLASGCRGENLMDIAVDPARAEVILTPASPKALPVKRSFVCAEELCLYIQGVCAGYVAAVVAKEAQLHEPQVPALG